MGKLQAEQVIYPKWKNIFSRLSSIQSATRFSIKQLLPEGYQYINNQDEY